MLIPPRVIPVFGVIKSNQIRSIKGIERLCLLLSLVHLFCTIGTGSIMQFGEGLRKARCQTKVNNISWIYQCAKMMFLWILF
ncbi:hypothetical protein AN1V17_02250 [Vallitalea sediminicola]